MIHVVIIKIHYIYSSLNGKSDCLSRSNWQLISRMTYNILLTGARNCLLVLKPPEENCSLLITLEKFFASL